MRRRGFLSAALAPFAAPAQSPPGPNVILFLADDLGWRDVGFHGSEIRTPAIDRLAKGGVRFSHFYSYPLCSPTRAGLMTGRSPMRYGVQYHVIRPWLEYGVPLSEHFLPQTFQAAGYQTGMAGKWHLGHHRRAYLPNARGFGHAYGHLNGNIDYYTHMREGGLDWHRNGRSVREEGYSTDLIGAEASRFIRSRDKKKPFFLYVPFNAPHTPLQAPPELIAKYSSIVDEKRRVFAAMVEAMDTAVGGVLDTLAQERILRDTLILFFSDNGGPVGAGARNNPLRGAKGGVYEGGIRVPAVFHWEGRLKPGETRQAATVLDVFPTLAGACGVAPRNTLPLDGRDLWKEISTGKAVEREDLFFAVEPGKEIQLAVRRGPWKLVRHVPRSGAATNELYKLDEDPHEQTDLAARNPALVKELAARAEQWRAQYPKDGVRAEAPQPPGWKCPQQWAEAAL